MERSNIKGDIIPLIRGSIYVSMKFSPTIAFQNITLNIQGHELANSGCLGRREKFSAAQEAEGRRLQARGSPRMQNFAKKVDWRNRWKIVILRQNSMCKFCLT